MEPGIAEITEGTTRMLVPGGAVTGTVPPREPAFFNPRARMNRDMSILAYSALARGLKSRTFIDAMAGVGSLGLRVANETRFEEVVINDLNPGALRLARRSAAANGLHNAKFAEKEACRLCADHARTGGRALAVDIDPFGSPARFVDCGMRATMHGGVLSVTATDLQVLNGLFDDACMRRYGGVPARTEYGNETAIRLVLGCMRHIAARMDVEIEPLFVQSHMHYYRVFVRVLNRPDPGGNIGYIAHCDGCGHREAGERRTRCYMCGANVRQAGPLWTGRLFDAEFVGKMIAELDGFNVHRRCGALLSAALLESEMPPAYYTLDEIASRMRASPIRLSDIVDRLSGCGFMASPTSLDPTGFRTDAPINAVMDAFSG